MTDTSTVHRVADQVQRFVDEVEERQLGLPSPCTEWDVRGLLNHMTAGGHIFAACIEQGACPDELLTTLMTEDQVGDDPGASWRNAAAAFERAAQGADPDKVVSTPWGEMPVGVILDIATADLTVHTIDLAVATGADLDRFDPELLATADDLAHKYFAPEARGPEFAPPVAVAADAHPALRLAGFAGRAI